MSIVPMNKYLRGLSLVRISIHTHAEKHSPAYGSSYYTALRIVERKARGDSDPISLRSSQNKIADSVLLQYKQCSGTASSH